jgi:hypothetical protein
MGVFCIEVGGSSKAFPAAEQWTKAQGKTETRFSLVVMRPVREVRRLPGIAFHHERF